MDNPDLPRMDKTVFRVTTFAQAEEEDRREMWAKTPEQRLQEVECLRQVIYGYTTATARLARVIEITRLPER